jgi:hydrogenase maturation protease
VVDLENAGDGAQSVVLDAHAMNPVSVLQLARSIGDISSRIFLIGCEPATLGGEEGEMGLSSEVSGVVDSAAGLVERLVTKILEGGKPEELF